MSAVRRQEASARFVVVSPDGQPFVVTIRGPDVNTAMVLLYETRKELVKALATLPHLQGWRVRQMHVNSELIDRFERQGIWVMLNFRRLPDGRYEYERARPLWATN